MKTGEPDELHHAEPYRGHKITVDVVEARPGCWSWSYLIDGKVQGQLRGALRDTRDEAMRQGIAAARARADEL